MIFENEIFAFVSLPEALNLNTHLQVLYLGKYI